MNKNHLLKEQTISHGWLCIKLLFTFPIFYPIILMYFFTAYTYDAHDNMEKASKHFKQLEFWSTVGFLITFFILFIYTLITALSFIKQGTSL